MKKLLFIAITGLIFTSCSDKLTESKVEKLVNDCLEKNPFYGTQTITSGKVSYLPENAIAQYEELSKKGLLTIEKKEEKNGWFTDKYHLISFTDKAQPFIIETDEISKDMKRNKIKLYTYKLDKVGGIQEIPSMNVSEVSVTYIKSEKTPFYDVLESDKTDYINEKIGLKKTENKGWIYCDE